MSANAVMTAKLVKSRNYKSVIMALRAKRLTNLSADKGNNKRKALSTNKNSMDDGQPTVSKEIGLLKFTHHREFAKDQHKNQPLEHSKQGVSVWLAGKAKDTKKTLLASQHNNLRKDGQASTTSIAGKKFVQQPIHRLQFAKARFKNQSKLHHLTIKENS